MNYTKEVELTKDDLLGCVPTKVRDRVKQELKRNCFSCAYFAQTEDSNLCWHGDAPTEISIREDCAYWEREE